MRYKIKEAIAYYAIKNNGADCTSKLAEFLFPGAKPDTRRANMKNLLEGRRKNLICDEIQTICRITGVNPNFLTGWTD